MIELHSSRTDAAGWAQRACQPEILLRGQSDGAALHRDGQIIRRWNSPLDALNWMQRASFDDLSIADARWIGFLSYDLGRLFEDLPATSSDDLDIPLFAFGLCAFDAAYRFPSPSTPGEGWGEGSSQSAIGNWQSEIVAPPRSTFSRDKYLLAVRRCIDYIAAGDVFQINLSQRFTAPSSRSPAEIFRRLIARTPAWYGALIELDDFALICNSPELFLHVTPDRRVITRPIKGTRPRQSGMEQELLRSAKDQAELNMIVDLERNDLGRVCEIGSVRVSQSRVIEAHPTVFHGAATIEGTLRSDVTLIDLLRATFPGGSVTGAPKIRAMQIIEELEPVRRGPYCGAIGCVASSGEMTFNIAIRTMIVRDGQVHIPVGGGIVADSDPIEEYEETLVKARAMFAALGLNA